MRNVTYVQVLVMAAIVATLFLLPAAGLVWLGCALLDAPFESLVTFGHALPAPAGAFAWWGIAFLPALAYAGFMRKAG